MASSPRSVPYHRSTKHPGLDGGAQPLLVSFLPNLHQNAKDDRSLPKTQTMDFGYAFQQSARNICVFNHMLMVHLRQLCGRFFKTDAPFLYSHNKSQTVHSSQTLGAIFSFPSTCHWAQKGLPQLVYRNRSIC